MEAVLIAFIAISCGLSPFLYGFYDVSVWGPIALGMLAALLGLLIARPAAPRRAALVAGGALAGMWLWAFISTGWAESADQALTEANRWLLYAALFGVLVLLLRDDRLGTVVVGAGAAVILALGGYIVVRMLGGSGDELFLGGRLHEPLGYINAQSGYLLLGIWPLIALAERARQPVLAGAGLAGATFLAGLVLLGQTRAVVPAILLSALLLLAAVPGRTRRAWALALVGAGVAACIGPVLDVYDSGAGAAPGDGELRDAALAILLAAAGGGSALGARHGSRRAAGVEARARRLAWAPLAAGALVAVVVVLAAIDDPAGEVRDRVPGVHRARSRVRRDLAVHQRRRQPLRLLARGASTSSPTTRCAAWARATTTAPTSPSARPPRTSDSPTASSSKPWASWAWWAPPCLRSSWARSGSASGGARARARADLRARGLTVAAGGTFAVWLVHTSVDWLHLIPGVDRDRAVLGRRARGPVGATRAATTRGQDAGRRPSWSAGWRCSPARSWWVARRWPIAT